MAGNDAQQGGSSDGRRAHYDLNGQTKTVHAALGAMRASLAQLRQSDRSANVGKQASGSNGARKTASKLHLLDAQTSNIVVAPSGSAPGASAAGTQASSFDLPSLGQLPTPFSRTQFRAITKSIHNAIAQFKGRSAVLDGAESSASGKAREEPSAAAPVGLPKATKERYVSLLRECGAHAATLSAAAAVLGLVSVMPSEPVSTSATERTDVQMSDGSTSGSARATPHPPPPLSSLLLSKRGGYSVPFAAGSLHAGALQGDSANAGAPPGPIAREQAIASLDVLGAALEGAARSLGLETFAERMESVGDSASKSESEQTHTHTHTVTLGGKVLVVDLELGLRSLSGPSASASTATVVEPTTKLKISYATPTNGSSNGMSTGGGGPGNKPKRDPALDGLLARDVEALARLLFGLATVPPKGVELESAPLAAQAHLSRFSANLASLVALDELGASASASSSSTAELTDNMEASLDLFGAMETLASAAEARGWEEARAALHAEVTRAKEEAQDGDAAMREISDKMEDGKAGENLARALAAHPRLARTLCLSGHGIPLLHSGRPYLTLVYRTPPHELPDEQQGESVLDTLDARSLHPRRLNSGAGPHSLRISIESRTRTSPGSSLAPPSWPLLSTGPAPSTPEIPSIHILGPQTTASPDSTAASLSYVAHLEPPIALPRSVARQIAQIGGVASQVLDATAPTRGIASAPGVGGKPVPHALMGMMKLPQNVTEEMWFENALAATREDYGCDAEFASTKQGAASRRPLRCHFSISTPPGRIRNLDEQGVLVSALPFNTLDQFWEMVEILRDQSLINELLAASISSDPENATEESSPANDDDDGDSGNKDVTLDMSLSGNHPSTTRRSTSLPVTLSYSLGSGSGPSHLDSDFDSSRRRCMSVHLGFPIAFTSPHTSTSTFSARHKPSYTLSATVQPQSQAPHGWHITASLRPMQSALSATVQGAEEEMHTYNLGKEEAVQPALVLARTGNVRALVGALREWAWMKAFGSLPPDDSDGQTVEGGDGEQSGPRKSLDATDERVVYAELEKTGEQEQDQGQEGEGPTASELATDTLFDEVSTPPTPVSSVSPQAPMPVPLPATSTTTVSSTTRSGVPPPIHTQRRPSRTEGAALSPLSATSTSASTSASGPPALSTRRRSSGQASVGNAGGTGAGMKRGSSASPTTAEDEAEVRRSARRKK